jgi:MoxR-like ATPase
MAVVETSDAVAQLDALQANLSKVIQGKPEALRLLLTALLAHGSVLMEDVPGVGKTTLAKALARSLDASFHRIQFTPDLLPADILGMSIYNPKEGEFNFRAGPIFCNILLADEINRASPRTQSALLEAMSEAQASIEGVSRPLPEPFLVLATQNPIEFHGTYPLPEAQLDRFFGQLDIGYPDAETEVDILEASAKGVPVDELSPVLSGDAILAMQQQVRQVPVEASVARYVVDLVHATRDDSRLKLGASPRGSLMLYRGAQAAAFLAGRNYVLPDDVQRIAPFVLAHRLVLTPKARYGGVSKADVVRDILSSVRVPS